MPESARKLRVFLCHASQDKPVVRELYNRLLAEGWIEPWLDVAKLLPGQHWTSVIRETLNRADAVIIFVSNSSLNKEGFVQRELNYAWEKSLEKPRSVIYLIPLRLEDCDVPYDLHERQWADYFGDKKEETYKALLQSLLLRREQKFALEGNQLGNENLEAVPLSETHQAINQDDGSNSDASIASIPQKRQSSNKAAKSAAQKRKKKRLVHDENSGGSDYLASNESKKEWVAESSNPVIPVSVNNKNQGDLLTQVVLMVVVIIVIFGCLVLVSMFR